MRALAEGARMTVEETRYTAAAFYRYGDRLHSCKQRRTAVVLASPARSIASTFSRRQRALYRALRRLHSTAAPPAVGVGQ